MNTKRRIPMLAVSALAFSFAIGGLTASDLHAKAAALADNNGEAAVTAARPTDSTQHKPARGFGFGTMKHDGGIGIRTMLNDPDAVADLLGLSPDEWKEALAEGKSLADIAAEQGIDVQAVIDALITAMKTPLDERLADGRITQAQYDENVAKLDETAAKLANGEFRGKGQFGRSDIGMHRYGMAVEQWAELLSVTTEELKEALAGGKSLADIAAEQGIDVQAVIDAFVNRMIERLDEKLADGSITQDQYDEMKSRFHERATAFVNGDVRLRGGIDLENGDPGLGNGFRPKHDRGINEFRRGVPRELGGDNASGEPLPVPETPLSTPTTVDAASL